ncbi:MAG: prefoldin subunit alpha [archaeon YNP-LCB-003-016]|jgi:prefoldin alpha subunit|uniref:prefoldin subunit alpha n=1 Tax=Candidatus Culexarchaeum yellowstonense TaxID=2928963 RepID=UPI0026F2D77B|nr:prefoldin subunit alpha [Candidatus Culexarchaeum yellowstonense]MCC6017779.1 prefoldin subunit alpha [Candidatus Verstraetearchaeota archaeon]MCR6690838.1 prefoldin subunit alpha [Candidatus Culexarchaeum yellowstonense]
MKKIDRKEVEEEVGRLYAQITTLNSIADALKEQSEILQRQIIDTQLALETLNEISKLEKNHKVILPLGSQIMVDAVIVDNENAYVNVGSNIIIKKPNKEVIEILEKRMEALQKQQMEIQQKLTETLSGIEYLQNQLNTLIQQLREKGT